MDDYLTTSKETFAGLPKAPKPVLETEDQYEENGVHEVDPTLDMKSFVRETLKDWTSVDRELAFMSMVLDSIKERKPLTEFQLNLLREEIGIKQFYRSSDTLEQKKNQQAVQDALEKARTMFGPGPDTKSSMGGRLPSLDTTLSKANRAVPHSPSEDGQHPDLELDKGSSFGMKPSVKNLYQGPGGTVTYPNWVEEHPDDIIQTEPIEFQEESQQHALIVRHSKSQDKRRGLEINSIVVQSPLLKTVLESVFKGYAEFETSANKWAFLAPFKLFFYFWRELDRILQDEKDATIQLHLLLLYTVVGSELKEVFNSSCDMIARGIISFDLLWTIFLPNVDILSRKNTQDRIFGLVGSGTEMKWYVEDRYNYYGHRDDTYHAKCKYVDSDGDSFHYGFVSFGIPKFEGAMEILSLAAFPIDYHPKAVEIRKTALERGRKFETLRGRCFKQYKDSASPVSEGSYGTEPGKEQFVNSRLIIDTKSYYQFNPSMNIDATSAGQIRINDSDKLSEHDFTLCNSHIWGYSMKHREWMAFQVRFVEDIDWNDKAFGSVVMDPDRKELIHELVKSQISGAAQFDDLVKGKGQGLVILFGGGPGVGKTLTVESVADRLRVPLFLITAGELGTNADLLERTLLKLFELVSHWKGILLIDEADILLEQRTTTEITRNGLVAVFLRLLEYYSGVLFLTTNNIHRLDQAFQSRIHIFHHYPDLDETARREIWTTFFKISDKENTISKADMDDLAGLELNGREIKNAIKAAGVLADRKKEPLSIGHLKVILECRPGNKLPSNNRKRKRTGSFS